MTRRACMFRRVLVRRAVATKRHAALLARTQVQPAISRLHTLRTNSFFRLLDLTNAVDMSAYSCWHGRRLTRIRVRPRESVATNLLALLNIKGE